MVEETIHPHDDLIVLPTKTTHEPAWKRKWNKYLTRSNILIAFFFITSLIIAQFIVSPQSLLLRAVVGSANIAIQPTSSTLPPNKSYQVWVTTSQSVGFITMTLNYDPSKVKLTAEPTIVLPGFNKITLTSMAEANTTGKIVIMSGLDPLKLANAPVGTFQYATLPFAPVGNASTQTAINVNLPDVQIADLNVNALTLTADNASISVNPASPTAGSTPAPTIITPTSAPFITPTKAPSITPTRAPTSTPFPTAQPTFGPTPIFTTGIPHPTSTRFPSPTSLPITTSRPVITPTSKPAVKPTSIPSPIPPPPHGQLPPNTAPPVINTHELRKTITNQPYSVRITANDHTAGDTLYMNATQLPAGLRFGDCQLKTGSGTTIISCTLSGTLKTSGTHYPTIIVTDAAGHTISKTYTIEAMTLRNLIRSFFKFRQQNHR